MDLREKKTRRSISNAFLQLRAYKPLERITVKELSELAEISKATFYLHYRDIYDLSDALEKEVIENMLKNLPHPDALLSDYGQFMKELITAFHSQQNIIGLLFSGSQANILPKSIEEGIKQYIFQTHPEYIDDAKFNTQLTFQIQGGYFAYTQNRQLFPEEQILPAISELLSAPKLP